MSDSPLLALVQAFVPLSFATIGGGQSALADIHRQVVEVHQWLGETQFLDDYAISRMAPGPGSLLVALLGWRIAGGLGALVAFLAISLPTALMIFVVARIWNRYQGARALLALEAGLRPVAAGLLLSSAWVLLNAQGSGWIGRAVALASTAALMASPVNPILLLASGAGIFSLLYWAGLM